jgi:hypothetical protein
LAKSSGRLAQQGPCNLRASKSQQSNRKIGVGHSVSACTAAIPPCGTDE